MKGDYQSMGNSYSVEIWINDMGENERCKEILPIAASRTFSSKLNISGNYICMVGYTCDKEQGYNHIKSKVKILDSHSQIWSEDT